MGRYQVAALVDLVALEAVEDVLLSVDQVDRDDDVAVVCASSDSQCEVEVCAASEPGCMAV